jgi:hypothetical protein
MGGATAAVMPPAASQVAPAQQEQAFDDRVDDRGEAQVTLIWEGSDDLDLAMSCPSGATISYNNAHACGGDLDIDQNARAISPNPVENITFPQGLPEPGDYKIAVKLYTSRTGAFPVPFKVRIRDQNGTRFLPGQAIQNGQVIIIGQMSK